MTLFLGRVPLLKSTTEKKGTLVLTSLMEDLGNQAGYHPVAVSQSRPTTPEVCSTWPTTSPPGPTEHWPGTVGRVGFEGCPWVSWGFLG